MNISSLNSLVLGLFGGYSAYSNIVSMRFLSLERSLTLTEMVIAVLAKEAVTFSEDYENKVDQVILYMYLYMLVLCSRYTLIVYIHIYIYASISDI